MATMIGILTSDVDIPSPLLKKALKQCVDKSFNRITVDGDTSVCDKVLVLANGESGFSIESEDSDEFMIFTEALCEISTELAKSIASDGEGATKLIEINVTGAASPGDALLAAKAIANSPLVKTAFYGEDANWGRIITAAGYSGADFDPDGTSVSIGGLMLFEKGRAIHFSEQEAIEILKKDDITVTVDFGSGEYGETVWTCDMSHGYIDINAHYRT
jgi:glutamate N-acetyltransferase/amino-acid N-acetyltransferase